MDCPKSFFFCGCSWGCAFYIGAHKGTGDLNSLSALNHFYATHTTRAHLVTPSISQEKLDQK